MHTQQDHTHANLAQLAPVLDEAIDKLEVEDRAAIWLRFFEEQDFRSMGEMLNTSEEAARKRVARALEKLHSFLTHRGVSLSVVALGAALASNTTQAAPASLKAIIVGKALKKTAYRGALRRALSQQVTKTMLWVGGVSAVIVAAVMLAAKEQETRRRLQDENSLFRKQIGELTAAIQQSSNKLAQASAHNAADEQLKELLRLRGQVALLKRQIFTNDTRVAAIVNGRSILESEVRESIAKMVAEIKKLYSKQPAIIGQKLEELWTNNVESLINRELAVEDFDRRGLKVSEQELSEVIAQDNSASHDRERCRRRIIWERMRKANLGEIIEPTPEDIEHYYSANQKEFWEEDRVNIFIAAFRKGQENDSEPLRQEANSLRQQVMSEGTSRLMERGDKNRTGFTVRQAWYDVSALRSELARAVGSLSPSGVSEVIETQDQLFIVQLLEKHPAYQKPLDEVTTEITKMLLSKRREAVLQNWYNRLQSQAAIERFPVPRDL